MKFSIKKKLLILLKFWRSSWFGLTLISIVSLWAVTFAVINYWKAPNEIGDSFGMVNALFSGLAFAFIVYTSWMQRKELQLQRIELKQTRKEIAQATEAHKKHVELVQLQIDNQREQLLREFKPDLRIKPQLWSFEDPDTEFRFEFSTSLKKCILKEINVYKFSESIISENRYDKLIEPKRDKITEVIPAFADTCWIIVNYVDERGHNYHYMAVYSGKERFQTVVIEKLGYAVMEFKESKWVKKVF